MDQLAYKVRVTEGEQGAARVTARRHQLTIGRPVAFDVDSRELTALECALGAIGAELVTGLRVFAARRRIEIEVIESTVEGRLAHPLTYLEVVGEPGRPRLSEVVIKVYVMSPHDRAALQELWNDMIERLPLVVTFKRALDLRVELAITE